ncbi:MAG TPA: hypothetical protein VIF12_04445, partial [Micavibrio sp.]
MSKSLSLVFNSFILGGFEGAQHKNKVGRRRDMIADTRHDIQAESDYAALRKEGITSIRDGVRWPLIEREKGVYDFSSLAPMVDAAKDQGMQAIWTLCHYGWPDDIDVFSPDFVTRFADFCRATAEFIKNRGDGDVPFYTPVNEISFLADMAGEHGNFAPYAVGRGDELKKQLVRASIAGIDAIRKVDARARFVQVEPLLHIIAPKGKPEEEDEAARVRQIQFEAYDMLSGRRNPELGGNETCLDIIGLNFYHGNQWEHFGKGLEWHVNPRDERWMPLHKLVEEVY